MLPGIIPEWRKLWRVSLSSLSAPVGKWHTLFCLQFTQSSSKGNQTHEILSCTQMWRDPEMFGKKTTVFGTVSVWLLILWIGFDKKKKLNLRKKTMCHLDSKRVNLNSCYPILFQKLVSKDSFGYKLLENRLLIFQHTSDTQDTFDFLVLRTFYWINVFFLKM